MIKRIMMAVAILAAVGQPSVAKPKFPAVHGGCAAMYRVFMNAKIVHSVFVTSDGLLPSAHHMGSWNCESSARSSVAEAATVAIGKCRAGIVHFTNRGYSFKNNCTVVKSF